MSDDRWPWHCHDKYKLLNPDEVTKWEICPKCNEGPRIWIYDNGRGAKCLCFGKYEEGVRAIGVLTYANSHNGSLKDFPEDELQENWNKRCKLYSK